jgi:type II restriction/modification system DNA methylase subunit YeeA
MIDKQTNTRLKRFAQEARRYLIDQVNTKLSEVLALGSDAATYEKTKPLYNALLKEVLGVRDGESGEAALKPKTSHLTPNTYNLTPIAERVAYTWFNRLTALRYMDLKHFNPVGIISPQSGDTLPQILAEAKLGVIDSSLIEPGDRDRVLGLLSGTIASTYHKGDPQSEAYRILLLSACNHFGKQLPFLFKPIKDWMELLLPDDLLGEHGILAMIREVMTEEACQDVEVIGWLYQYYISEKKDEVFANVKKGKKVQSAEIPAVTQLFTPHWIVKYMVQNSLGRLWLDSHPQSSLKAKMEYYLEQDSDSADSSISQTQHTDLKVKSPEDIKFCDPCCGSGHILTYAFELLHEIYSEEGYDPIDIPRLIISKNLYGIEIDERASELAAFALAMKARDKDRQWFSRAIDPKICRLENIRFTAESIHKYLDVCGRDIFTYNFERMLSQFEYADTFGSLIVPHEQDIEGIKILLIDRDLEFDTEFAGTHKQVMKLIEQADYLSTKYQVVVTNPPYMGKGMSDKLSKYLSDNYNDAKSDLFSAFILRNLNLCLPGGQLGFMTPFVWMFISSYEKLRKHLIKHTCITSLIQLEYSGFDGATVPICTFTLENSVNPKPKGGYIKLSEFRGSENQAPRTLEAIANPDCGWFFRCKTSEFTKIPGAPIAYWVSDKIRDIFSSSKPLADVASPKQGLATADNDRFLRLWFETSLDRIGFGMKNRLEARQSGKKWFPYNKGGEFRKWYGNQEFVVNWENDGEEIRNFTFDNGKQRSVVRNPDYYFRESVSWSKISSGSLAMRFFPNGFLFDVAGCSLFSGSHCTNMKVLGLTNTLVIREILAVMSPTLNFEVGQISNIPYPVNDKADVGTIENLLRMAIDDWDSYETSWDFQQLPLIKVTGDRLQVTVKEVYAKLREQWIENTLKMQELEEENNRIFIEAYGLQDELSPDVPLKEITLTCNPYYRYGVDAEVTGDRLQGGGDRYQVTGDRGQVGARSEALIKPSSTLNQALTINAKLTLDEDLIKSPERGSLVFPIRKDIEDRLLADTMKELISYAVGCMFGRYSLDKPGLILANQGEGVEDYFDKVLGVSGLGVRGDDSGEAALKPNTQNLKPSFMPDKDNVIPILEGEWFADDIVSRFTEFLKVAFGTEKYSENISFIEEALGKDLRAYFLKDFYNDHVKRYKKRPIYWLFSSPKGSFNALIYMHRYTPDTVSILLNGYLREYIHKLRAKVSQLEHQLNTGDQSERDKMLTRKEIERLKDIISELEAWESKVILPLAEKRLEIDLDDGVKVNYGKFGEALKRC